jgi:uncharacterized protein (DUF1697 family)
MGTYVGFVRAINVAGHATVPMTALKQAFVAAGCADVRTLIQSGNVVFDVPLKKEKSAFRAIQAQLDKLLDGRDVVVFRALRHVAELVADSPFAKSDTGASVKLYVAFLAGEPPNRPAFPIALPREALEAIGMRGLDVFIVSRRKQNGMFGFPNNFIEDALRVHATTRNWSTVAKIAALAG